MKIILLRNIRGLGKRNDIKEVKDGYASNFLFPQKLALAANEKNIKKRDRWITSEKQEIEFLKKSSQKLSQEILVFKVKTGKKGEMFGSIKKEDIEKELIKKGYQQVIIELKKPIKFLGETTLPVNFGYGVRGEVKVCLLA